MIKRGAMFGLDARIALAIFGALSVISGAALYSAIQQSKVVAAVAELNELHKAYEQYWLDTGQELGRLSGVTVDVQQLVDNTSNITGWNGPYLSFEKNAQSHALTHPVYGRVKFFTRSINSAWGGTAGVDSIMPNTCTGVDEPCGRWAMIEFLNVTFAEAVDKYIDGSIDYQTGRMRVYCTSTTECSIYLLDGNSAPTS